MSDEWVCIRRFDDPLRFEMAKDFLREHGIDVRFRGNAGATGVLNRFDTVMDIRLDVRTEDLDAAREALAAFEVGESAEEPFRGLTPTKDQVETYVPERKTATAMMLGFLVPIGAAHFYARHGAAGSIFCAGIVGAVLGMMLGSRVELGLAWGLIIVADILGARAAVRRYNAGNVPSEGKQRAVASAVVAAAFALALAFGIR